MAQLLSKFTCTVVTSLVIKSDAVMQSLHIPMLY